MNKFLSLPWVPEPFSCAVSGISLAGARGDRSEVKYFGLPREKKPLVPSYLKQTDVSMVRNRPRLICQYSDMATRLSGQTSVFGSVFFVSKSLLEIERQKKLLKNAILIRKPQIHVELLIYRTRPTGKINLNGFNGFVKQALSNKLWGYRLQDASIHYIASW